MNHTFLVTVVTRDDGLDSACIRTIANEIKSNLEYEHTLGESAVIERVRVRHITHGNYRVAVEQRHFQHAAAMVKAILEGYWTHALPEWSAYPGKGSDETVEVDTADYGNLSANYVRAVWTAEAFIQLFSAYNPLFDQQRFLIACGLVAAPVKPKRSRKARA